MHRRLLCEDAVKHLSPCTSASQHGLVNLGLHDFGQFAQVLECRVKLGAIALSGGFMGLAGAFYVQVFQYIDPGLAFGPTTSVEALVAAIVGGMGTLWGPLLGAAVLHLLGELTRNLFGQLPGLNMVVYGSVLVLIVMFVPRGLSGVGRSVRDLLRRPRG